MPAERPFNKYSLPGRLKPLRDRRNQPVETQERIARFAIPSWEKMSGILELRMNNNPDLFTLYLKHRNILREFYNARYDIAIGVGTEKFEKFKKERYENNKPLMTKLSPHMRLIRDSISPQRPAKR